MGSITTRQAPGTPKPGARIIWWLAKGRRKSIFSAFASCLSSTSAAVPERTRRCYPQVGLVLGSGRRTGWYLESTLRPSFSLLSTEQVSSVRRRLSRASTVFDSLTLRGVVGRFRSLRLGIPCVVTITRKLGNKKDRGSC